MRGEERRGEARVMRGAAWREVEGDGPKAVRSVMREKGRHYGSGRV